MLDGRASFFASASNPTVRPLTAADRRSFAFCFLALKPEWIELDFLLPDFLAQ
jgi:hypothetical protein